MLSATFDVISCFMYFEHSKYKMFDTNAPRMVLVAQAVFILTPVLLFASAMCSYSIYSDCRAHDAESSHLAYGANSYDYEAAAVPVAPRQQPRPPTVSNFQGTGHRLQD